MTSRAYTIHLVNENTEAWIKTDAAGKVYAGSPNIVKRVMDLELSNAIQVLEANGWEVESWDPE